MDPSPLIAAGGSVGLFIAIAGLLFRLIYVQNDRDRTNAADIATLKAENAWCNRRVSILIFACQKGGIEIPPEVWDGPPQIVVDPDSPADRRRRRGDNPGRNRGNARGPSDDIGAAS